MAWGSRREMVGSAATAEAKMRRDRMLTILKTRVGSRLEPDFYLGFLCVQRDKVTDACLGGIFVCFQDI